VFSAGGSTSSQGGGGKVIVPSHAYATFLGHSAMRIEHGHRGTYQPDQHKLIIASSVCLSRQSMEPYLSVRSKQVAPAST